MALYEIRTLMTRHRVSLISYGDFPGDMAAILAAHALLRRNEAFEVWRGTHLVYRIEAPMEYKLPRRKVRPARQ